MYYGTFYPTKPGNGWQHLCLILHLPRLTFSEPRPGLPKSFALSAKPKAESYARCFSKRISRWETFYLFVGVVTWCHIWSFYPMLARSECEKFLSLECTEYKEISDFFVLVMRPCMQSANPHESTWKCKTSSTHRIGNSLNQQRHAMELPSIRAKKANNTVRTRTFWHILPCHAYNSW